jgi:uncharacterized membrane protein YqjE
VRAVTDDPKPRRGLIRLVTDIPALVRELVEREIELVKTELIAKLKQLGIGAALLVGAVVVILAMLGVLLTAIILALSLVMPGWAAALIVAGVLVLIAALLAFLGYRRIVKTGVPIPTVSVDSLQRDLRAIKGIGKRGDS